ncbi:MAG: hypothetical protein ACREX8_05625 [Gammaproteobacteria bacterium]
MTDDAQLTALFQRMCQTWTDGTQLPKRRLSRQTLVATRTPDGWRFAALHNTRVRPMQIPAPDSFPARAARRIVRISRSLRLGAASP